MKKPTLFGRLFNLFEDYFAEGPNLWLAESLHFWRFFVRFFRFISPFEKWTSFSAMASVDCVISNNQPIKDNEYQGEN